MIGDHHCVVCRIDVTIRYRIHSQVRESPTKAVGIETDYRRGMYKFQLHLYHIDFTQHLWLSFFA